MMKTDKNWLDPISDMPSWAEIGAPIEVELVSGETLMGVIEQFDMTPGPGEEPLFFVRAGDAKISWFDEIKKFRFMPTKNI